jgi:hypothetical protein
MRPPGGSNIFARRCFGHAANTSYIVFAGRISTDGLWQRERELEAFSKEMDNLRKLTEIVDAQVRWPCGASRNLGSNCNQHCLADAAARRVLSCAS